MNRSTRIALVGIMLAGAASVASVNMVLARGGADGMRGGPMKIDFSAVDADGNGLVTLAELQAHGTASFAAADVDGSGGLDAAELAARISAGIAERQAARAAASEGSGEAPRGRRAGPDEKRIGWMVEGMIRHKDKDGDNVLSMAELQPDAARLERLIDKLDTDDDNAISLAEFEAAEKGRWQRMGARGGPFAGPVGGHFGSRP